MEGREGSVPGQVRRRRGFDLQGVKWSVVAPRPRDAA